MKNKSILLALIVLLFYENIAIAQTYKADKSEAVFTNFSGKNIENNFLASNTIIENNNVFSDENTIFIEQIGDDNFVKTKTKSKVSEINLYQNGNQNSIYLDLTAKTIEETVLQEGNNNYFLDFSSYGVDFHSAEVVQQGNNHNITWFGGNSISEKIKIKMEGDNKTIIVRNFN